MKRVWCAVCVAVLFLFCATVVSAQTTKVYDSIPKPLPGNVASMGPEAYAFMELGDGLGLLAGAGGTLGQVTVVLSSWACQSGNWSSGNCVTAAGATFSQPITVNVYAVNSGPTPGALLATITETFDIPYRPSTNPSCGADAGYGLPYATQWYSGKDKACYHGLAAPITVNFAGFHVTLPSNSIIVTVAFNSTDFGPNPIGRTACNSTSAGCPYDSLNISTDTSDGTFQFVGAPLDGTGIFVRPSATPYPYTPCSGIPGAMTAGVLADDSGCWVGYHPEIQVSVNTNTKPNQKGVGP